MIDPKELADKYYNFERPEGGFKKSDDVAEEIGEFHEAFIASLDANGLDSLLSDVLFAVSKERFSEEYLEAFVNTIGYIVEATAFKKQVLAMLETKGLAEM